MKLNIKNITTFISNLLTKKTTKEINTNDNQTINDDLLNDTINRSYFIDEETLNSYFVDPLKPIYKDFLSNVVDIDDDENDNKGKCESITKIQENIINLYHKNGRIMTVPLYKKTFKHLLSNENFFSLGKDNILKKLWEDSQTINKLLEPLNKLEISYTLDITGGAARDFVLNKHKEIKDIDFMVNISNKKSLLDLKELINKSDIFSDQERLAVSFEDVTASNVKQKLLQLCLNRFDDVEKSFFFDEESRLEIIPINTGKTYDETMFIKDRLLGVVKTKGIKTHYPIDILLTDYSKPQFLNDFDFDICKASFSLINEHYDTEFPKEYTHLISRFSATLDFYADVINNTLTYNTEGRSVRQIERSLSDHLPRLLNKYPENKVLLTSTESHFYPNAQSILTKYLLEKKFENKEAPIEIRKKI